MRIGKLRQILRVERRRPTGRLDDEDNIVFAHRQFVFSIAIGDDDFASIGNCDIGHAFRIGRALTSSGSIVKDAAARDLRGFVCAVGGHGGSLGEKLGDGLPRNGACRAHQAAEKIATIHVSEISLCKYLRVKIIATGWDRKPDRCKSDCSPSNRSSRERRYRRCA